MVFARTILTLVGLLLLITPGHASEQRDWLAARLDSTTGTGPAFVASYDAPAGSNDAGAAYTYDQALAIMAFLAEKDAPHARRIADALVFAQGHDRTVHDGRVRNAYAAGAVDAAPVKLPGYWDKAQNRWIEDGYQDGAATGNNAWAGLALLKLAAATGDAKYAEAARGIGRFLVDVVKPDHGFRGGFEGFDDHPETLGWKSTEHNIDAAAFLTALDRRFPKQGFREGGTQARQFVDSMWAGDHWNTGTLPDGTTPNREYSSLDAQTFAVLSINQAAMSEGPMLRGRDAMKYLERTHGVPGGFDYSDAKSGIWLEGTAQAALAYKFLGMNLQDKAGPLLANLHHMSKHGELDAVAGINGAPPVEMRTGLKQGNGEGLKWSYFPRPALAPVAWLVLADAGIDPFVVP